jgi:pimeloyl-ACP methyl ester carboxylesterase
MPEGQRLSDTRSDPRDDRVLLPNGMTFHVRSHGPSDGAPLVFLHGVFAAAVSYDTLCRGLAGGRLVIAIDQRGHGETDHADDYAWERWVEDIALLVDALGLDVIDLVGHSMGAGHAARFAALHPGRVQRLALLEGGFGATNSPLEPEYWGRVMQLFPVDGFATLDDYVVLSARLFPRGDRTILDESAAHFVMGDDGRWRWPLQADPKVAGPARTQPSPEHEQRLRRSVTCPTLVAKAEHSELFTGDSYAQAARDFPSGRHEILMGTGHMLMWEGVPNTLAVLEDFLR